MKSANRWLLCFKFLCIFLFPLLSFSGNQDHLDRFPPLHRGLFAEPVDAQVHQPNEVREAWTIFPLGSHPDRELILADLQRNAPGLLNLNSLYVIYHRQGLVRPFLLSSSLPDGYISRFQAALACPKGSDLPNEMQTDALRQSLRYQGRNLKKIISDYYGFWLGGLYRRRISPSYFNGEFISAATWNQLNFVRCARPVPAGVRNRAPDVDPQVLLAEIQPHAGEEKMRDGGLNHQQRSVFNNLDFPREYQELERKLAARLGHDFLGDFDLYFSEVVKDPAGIEKPFLLLDYLQERNIEFYMLDEVQSLCPQGFHLPTLRQGELLSRTQYMEISDFWLADVFHEGFLKKRKRGYIYHINLKKVVKTDDALYRVKCVLELNEDDWPL